MVGITAYGGYIPRYRLNRQQIYQSMGWMDPSTFANSKGEKAVANFDEDTITMAVAAGMDLLKGFDRSKVGGVYFASTTMPYKERLNAGILMTALGLDETVRAADITGARKAGTTAILSAIEGIKSKMISNLLVCAADSRLGKPATAEEMIYGDAAAALMLGDEDVIAEFKDAYTITCDFVDRYRGEFGKFDRKWEDRWCRDEGYGKLIPEAINGLLKKCDLKISDFSKVIYDCHYVAARRKLNNLLEIAPEQEQDNFQETIGESGAAQVLVMLVNALEKAKPGDKLMVVSFGSGCDALYFKVTDSIRSINSPKGVSSHLANRAELDQYSKYLVWRDILSADLGLRGEEDFWTRWSWLWRKRREVLGLWGSKCTACGVTQFPKQRVCANPDCGAIDEVEEYCFSDKVGKIKSFTGDSLSATYNPPAFYGAIEFEGGGKHYFDFTDCDENDVEVGKAVTMSFRKKYFDKARELTGYFWKAVPLREVI